MAFWKELPFIRTPSRPSPLVSLPLPDEPRQYAVTSIRNYLSAACPTNFPRFPLFKEMLVRN